MKTQYIVQNFQEKLKKKKKKKKKKGPYWSIFFFQFFQLKVLIFQKRYE